MGGTFFMFSCGTSLPVLSKMLVCFLPVGSKFADLY